MGLEIEINAARIHGPIIHKVFDATAIKIRPLNLVTNKICPVEFTGLNICS